MHFHTRSWTFGAAATTAMVISGTAHAQNDVTIDVDQFGVGSMCRPGEITPIRLKLTSARKDPTPVWVQWEVPNADGDIGEYGRSLTLTPGQPAQPWLYAPLPQDVSNSSYWTVRVFEERDGVRREEIGGTRISPGSSLIVEPFCGMLAVIGDRRVGLDGYTAQGQGNRPAGAHEDTRVAAGIKPSELPDRWYGLKDFEAIVWAGDKASPQMLGVDQADALREYVREGGHLIIALPDSVGEWGLGVVGKTQIEDLLPCRTPGVVPRLDEAVALIDLLPVISKYNSVKNVVNGKPPEFSIHVFKDLHGDFNVIDNHFEPLIALQDGRVVVIQRTFGHGRITVVGLNLADGRYSGLSAGGLPQADAFWNRILGRRCDTPTSIELTKLQENKKLGRGSFGSRDNNLGSGALITVPLNFRSEVGLALLLALVLFIAYWLIAGPIGFGVMKYYRVQRHSWVAFAGCAAVFTAITWLSIGALPKQMKVKHVTFLDHIARPLTDPRSEEPQYQRAVSFLAVFLPNYGSTPVSISSVPGQRDLLYSWTAPGAAGQQFPNVDRFRVDVARSPASLSLPARSTVTQLSAQWLGGLDPKWGGMLRVDPANPIKVNIQGDTELSLQGKIINELPGTLTNVTMIWVKNNRFTRRNYMQGNEPQVAGSGLPLNSISVWRLAVEPAWTTGKSFDLNIQEKPYDLQKTIEDRYIQKYLPNSMGNAISGGSVSDQDRPNYIEMLSIFQQLNPPPYLKTTSEESDFVTFHRELGRELDLSPWFSRPCLIIIGFLFDSRCPVPLRIDRDENPLSEGLTVVRWVYPLPLEEKIAFKDVFAAEKP